MWLDTSASGGIVEATGGISQITDLSGNARHLTQATSTKRPAKVTDGTSGRTMARFDGVDDTLSVSWTFGQPFTAYAVFKMRGVITPSGMIVAFHNWATTATGFYRSGGNVAAWGGSANIASAIAFTNNQNEVWTAIFNGVSSKFGRRGSITTGSGGTGGGINVTLGAAPDAGGAYTDVDFGELLVFTSAHGTTDCDAVNAYLKSKWGTP